MSLVKLGVTKSIRLETRKRKSKQKLGWQKEVYISFEVLEVHPFLCSSEKRQSQSKKPKKVKRRMCLNWGKIFIIIN